MAKIIVTINGSTQKEVSILKSRFTIGRRPGNDLVLDHLTISGQHAAIDTTPGGAFILDLGSTNGTLVNGQPITKHWLQNGDVVELGKYKLTFQQDAAVADPDAIAPTSVLPANNEEAAAVAQIKVLNGSNAGREIVLSKPVTTLGSPAVTVISITREKQDYFIAHVDGSVVPKVNDMPVSSKAVKLKHGDVIDLSGTKMAFSLSSYP